MSGFHCKYPSNSFKRTQVLQLLKLVTCEELIVAKNDLRQEKRKYTHLKG